MYLLELGGEDDRFAAAEARAAAAVDVDLVGPGLAVASTVSPDRVRTLAYTHRASDLLGRTDASVESARVLLETAPIDREGTVAVRARDVRGTTGVDTQRVERELGSVLVDRGFAVDLDDPDHELRAVFAWGPVEGDDDPADVDVCALGWLTAESVRDYGDRRPTDRPFFQPGSMDPLLARALVNLAGAGPGRRVVDPMCGTGGVLIEAALVGSDVVGSDAQAKMARGAAENLAALADADAPLGTLGDRATLQGDATHLPLVDDCAAAVVFDAPYGRQSKIEAERLDDLVSGALAEAARIAPRAVLVADREWAGVAREAGWDVVESFERRVHRSLVRYVLVLERRDGVD